MPQPSNPVDAVRTALATPSTCPSSTSITLQSLLSQDNKQPTTTAARGRPATVKASTTRKNAPVKATPKTKQAASTPSDVLKVLSPQERYKFATEVVNISLKVLTEVSRSSPTSSPSSKSSTSGLTVVAECARIAFSYLRAVRSPDAESLQLETGMLALASKLIAHGLDTLAMKELRILKALLQRRSNGQNTPPPAEKETLASLLHLECRTSDPAILSLAISYHLNVLRLVANTARSATTEAAVQYLDISEDISPAALLLRSAEQSADKTKQLRQLDSLSKLILSLCPPASSSADQAAQNFKTHASPDAVLKLQTIALLIQSEWWHLAGHEANLDKEFYEPLSRYLDAYRRRSTSDADQTYKLAVECVGRLVALEQGSLITRPPSFAIYRCLGILAESAGLYPDALRFTESMSSTSIGSPKPALRRLICSFRSIAIHLDQDDSNSLASFSDQIKSCRSTLEATTKDTSGSFDDLLVELSRLRKAIVKKLTSLHEDNGASISDDRIEGCELAVFCTEVLVWYHRQIPKSVVSKGLAPKLTVPFISSNLFTCKVLGSSSLNHVDMIHQALRDCRFLIDTLDEPEAHNLLLNVSNLYWRCFQLLTTERKQPPPPPQAIQCLQLSVDALRSCPSAVQEAGFLTTKLERLAGLAHTTDDSSTAFAESVRIQIATGILRELATNANQKPPSVALETHPKAELLRRNLRGYHITLVSDVNNVSFYDDETLDLLERALLLEIQLAFFEEDLLKPSRRRRARPDLQRLCKYLLVLYNKSDHPLRRARICIQLLKYAKEYSDLFDPQIMDELLNCETHCESLGLDQGLESFASYLSISLGLTQTLHSDSISIDKVNDFSDELSLLVDSFTSWEHLRSRIDNPDALASELQIIASFMALKGKDDFHLKSLQMLTRIHALQQSHKPSITLQSFSELALQYFRMGYSLEACRALEQGESYARQAGVSPLARLQWHLANTEIWVSIGKSEESSKHMTDANNALQSVSVTEEATKHQVQRARAHFSYVYSMFSKSTGLVKEAMLHAKRCVMLNQANLTYLEHRNTPQSNPDSSSVANPEDDGLVKAIDNLTISGPAAPSDGQSSLVRGAAFWTVVPDLLRGYLHLSDMYAHQGMRSEALYYLERADKLVTTVDAPGLRTKVLVQRESQARVVGTETMASASDDKSGDSINLVRLGITRGDIYTQTEAWDDANLEYEQAESMAIRLASKTFNEKLQVLQQQNEKLDTAKAVPARKTNRIAAKTPQPKAKVPARTKKPSTAKTKASVALSLVASQENVPLSSLCAAALRQRGLLLMGQGDVELGLSLLQKADSMKHDPVQDILQQIAMAQGLVFKFSDELALDFTFNVLPESTISYPALSTNVGKKPAQASLTSTPIAAAKIASPKKTSRQKRANDEFARCLCEAQERIMTIQHRTSSMASMSVFHQICGLGSKTMLLLSAINNGISPSGSLHPTRAACSLEMPRIEALSRELSTIEAEKSYNARDSAIGLPLPSQGVTTHLSASRFQKDYIDIIPDKWTAISLTISEDMSELYISRYRTKQAPFLLRLPMTRNKMQDLEEDEDTAVFDFASGKAELQEIIELSNYSCGKPPDVMTKEAKLNWWDEREALDLRMQELLVNIENIWLGGFRGILSQHRKDPALLARFRKSLEGVLDRHLPSRQGTKSRSKKLVLDSNILELFVGLGDDQDGEVDLDEQILDLLYFVIDVLQFNGERNAYDEVDFDIIATETLDALRSYHEAAHQNEADQNHLILILDRKLHAFPWESLPCLQGVSVSRVGSMLTLRERILAMRRQMLQKTEEVYTLPETSGTYILNPSTDLSRTQATMSPLLTSLTTASNSSWTPIANRAPTEKEFSGALSDSKMLLYFGHGSGNQYIRNRTIKKLPQCSEVVWLMGCSSGSVTENGDYEPTSVPLSYLVAGDRNPVTTSTEDDDGGGGGGGSNKDERSGLCMAVVATLWDVTDKDIDRFSVAVGEEWGLWTAEKETAQLAPKTPRKRGRSVPKTPSKTPSKGSKTPGRSRSVMVNDDDDDDDDEQKKKKKKKKMSLVDAVEKSRAVCHLRYLNGAAVVVYGVPVYLE